jgi:glycerol-3-phosphate acyltransferase PlsY
VGVWLFLQWALLFLTLAANLHLVISWFDHRSLAEMIAIAIGTIAMMLTVMTYRCWIMLAMAVAVDDVDDDVVACVLDIVLKSSPQFYIHQLFQYFLDGTVHHNEVMCCVAIP